MEPDRSAEDTDVQVMETADEHTEPEVRETAADTEDVKDNWDDEDDENENVRDNWDESSDEEEGWL